MNTDTTLRLWQALPLAPENDWPAIQCQITLRPALWSAVAHYLSTADLDHLPLGRNEIGEGAYCNVQEYDTRLEGKYEVHRRYLDIQLLTRGQELVWVAPLAACHDAEGEFDTAADCQLFLRATDARALEVSPRRWLVLFPTDAHMPCMALGAAPQPVRKVVVKVPL
ncbi:MAG: YhcH/YjgK/YiaL family protein [Bacteroidaceae bacterium]|nr:YhcH/YjgK/YiaL family protein [Bacteroidaceae bacterium]